MTTPIIVATPGASDANSYITKAEASTYFDSRLPLTPAWEDAEFPEAAIIMATRTLEAYAQPRRVFYKAKGLYLGAAYYLIARTWTGAPASTTQRLAWPRTGMYDRNGNAILSTVIPQELKDAQAEFAGQLLKTDRTLDSDIVVNKIKRMKAGSVELEFGDTVVPQVLPDAVFNLMPAAWFTDEVIEYAVPAEFEVL